ncbi:MAG: TetR/AcrR family transcriptional regulator [Rubrivivax sp.]|nr:TetR/AcrR family transcriptional regulator [Rubrivivax sp.]
MSSRRSGTTPRAAAAPAARRPAPARRDAYHHGALREALIEATEALLAERGTEGFSLREVARRSGVSPAAPAHHFGSAEGLLAAVATLAFDGLTEALRAGNARGGSDPVARLKEQGLGYVGFALRHPGRFGLMFRAGAAGVRKDEAFMRSAHAAFNVLEEGVRLLLGVPPAAPLSPAHWQAILSTWSVVHGFAHLALAGQFDHVGPGATADCEPAPAARRGGSAGATVSRTQRDALLRDVLAPLLEGHLRGLLATQEPR